MRGYLLAALLGVALLAGCGGGSSLVDTGRPPAPNR